MGISFMEKVMLASHIERKISKLNIDNSELEAKVYEDIERQIKREFGISRKHPCMKRKYLADAHELIDCYEAPIYLAELIEGANSQINLGVA